jgi:hypothetical protein
MNNNAKMTTATTKTKTRCSAFARVFSRVALSFLPFFSLLVAAPLDRCARDNNTTTKIKKKEEEEKKKIGRSRRVLLASFFQSLFSRVFSLFFSSSSSLYHLARIITHTQKHTHK